MTQTLTCRLIHSAFEPEPIEVATLSVTGDSLTECLNAAYDASQNIHESWIDNSEVVALAEHVRVRGGCRSTSVGDSIVTEHGTYQVASVGFKRLEA